MAVGIGVSTVLFTLVDAVVLQPLPYPEAERLVRIVDTNPQAGLDRTGAASANVHDWRQRTSAFAGIAGYYAMGRTLSTDRDAEVVISAQVSADFFADRGGRRRSLGRGFTDDEVAQASFSNAAMPTAANPVAIIGYGLWQSALRRRSGRHRPHASSSSDAPSRWSASCPRASPCPIAACKCGCRGTCRPRARAISTTSARWPDWPPASRSTTPSVSWRASPSELAVLHPATNQGWSVRLLPLREDTVGGAAGALWMLLGAVGLLLLVACANVALLTLMRGLDRAGDTAVRLALGASAARLVREFLMESVLLAGAGGLLGAAVAAAALRVLPAVAPDLPRVEEVSLDLRALLFVACVTTLSALLSGLPQAWRRARLAPASALAETSRRTTAGGRHLLRDGMVVAQVALAVVLLGGSGLLVRSVRALGATDPGFDPRGVVVAPVFLDSQAYNSGERTRTYYRTLFERLAALPGVVAVGGATTVPTSPLGPDFERPVWPEGTNPAAADRTPASVRMVTPGYFSALGLRLADGRAIDDRDAPTAPLVLMVNESLARRLWPGQSAVGRQLVVDYSTAGTYPYEIVGVVGDMRFKGPRSAPGPEIYLSHAQRPYLILNVVLKTSGDPRALMPAVQAALREIDPQKPAQGLYLLEDLLGATYARDRQVMATLLVFAGAATFLAVLSVYGVLSQRVRERTREIGIRMAMGADAAGLVGWVARVGVRLHRDGVGHRA